MIKTQLASFILTMIMTTAGGLELNAAGVSNTEETTAIKIAENAEGMGSREVDDADNTAKSKAKAIDKPVVENEDATKGALGEVIYNGVHFSCRSDVSVLDELKPLSFKLEDDDNEDKIQQFIGTDFSYYSYGDMDLYITMAEKNGKKELYDYTVQGPRTEMANGVKIGDSIERVVSICGEPSEIDDHADGVVGYYYRTKNSNVHYYFNDGKLYMVWVTNNAVVGRYYSEVI
ncbi:MAG: hypothetical protein J5802_10325 [Butyrivibrio sp.]|nr:hypothetical protein [Butyrivibrio sp.]